MVNNENSVLQPQQSFVFHGKGGQFFVICLVNLLLSIITIGIYVPWAFVRIRKYIYENMELNGTRFEYRATGGVFFLSWFLILVLFAIINTIFNIVSNSLAVIPWLILLLLTPLMAVKGLRYQAMVTSYNKVRFGFDCNNGKALWVMFVLPLLLSLAVAFVIGLYVNIVGHAYSASGFITSVTVLAVFVLIAMGVVNGVIYGKWMQLLGNGARFGIHRFTITVSIKRSIIINFIAMLIMALLLLMICMLLSAMIMNIVLSGGMVDETIVSRYVMQIAISYIIYMVGIIFLGVYIFVSLRNQFINGLKLGDILSFRSTITLPGMLMQTLVLVFASSLTLGLAYPWAKMRIIRYLASHTQVIGDLHALEMKDTDEQIDGGFFAAVSNGTMPALPFI